MSVFRPEVYQGSTSIVKLLMRVKNPQDQFILLSTYTLITFFPKEFP